MACIEFKDPEGNEKIDSRYLATNPETARIVKEMGELLEAEANTHKIDHSRNQGQDR